VTSSQAFGEIFLSEHRLQRCLLPTPVGPIDSASAVKKVFACPIATRVDEMAACIENFRASFQRFPSAIADLKALRFLDREAYSTIQE
jgi:hypothetical protein